MNVNGKSFSLMAGAGLVVLLCLSSTTWAQVAPPLGVAQQFGALGNSGVTGATGTGVLVTGDVGSAPTPSISNFPPSSTVPPFIVHNTGVQPDGVVVQAHTDAIAAYVALQIQGPGTVLPDNLTGAVLTSGIYSFVSGAPDLPATATLTLNGPGIFVFNVGSSLTANVLSTVTGTANPCNVFWRVGTSATLNGVNFWGTVLANASITLGNGANLVGRALAGTGATGAVTMAGSGGNTIGGCSVRALIPTTLTTQASAGVTLGGQISDTATLGGGTAPTGTITFTLFGPNNATCTGPAIFTSTVPVSGNAAYPSASFTPVTAGTYRWVATYSGDANNAAAATACNDPNESVIVAPPGAAFPTLTTQASSGVTLGGAISDTATLSGGNAPTGSITFTLFGPNNATCSGVAIFTSTVPVSGNAAYPSGPFVPVTAGTYRWVATYSGDANNAPAASACNAPNENVVVAAVGAALPTLTTQASPGVALGGVISDTATLSGGTTPTGTVTFSLFGPNNATCTGVPIFTSTVPVSGNGAYPSASFTPTTAGTYRWIANYNGDANNAPTANTCNAPNESVVVVAAPGAAAIPTLSEWATITMVVFLILFGVAGIRRRAM